MFFVGLQVKLMELENDFLIIVPFEVVEAFVEVDVAGSIVHRRVVVAFTQNFSHKLLLFVISDSEYLQSRKE